MVNNLSVNLKPRSYGNILRAGNLPNGRAVYSVIDSEGNDSLTLYEENSNGHGKLNDNMENRQLHLCERSEQQGECAKRTRRFGALHRYRE